MDNCTNIMLCPDLNTEVSYNSSVQYDTITHFENKYVIKRNGSEEEYNIEKIRNSLYEANKSDSNSILDNIIDSIDQNINIHILQNGSHTISVEFIQDIIMNELMTNFQFDVARFYIKYRYLRNQNKKTK
jgi:transcriptional regulator NrdR family protein